MDDVHYEDAHMALPGYIFGSRYYYVLGGPALISDETVQKVMKYEDVPEGPVGGPEL